MTVRELYSKLNAMYPKELALSWDNDGLMVCADQDREVRRVLVALDATLEAINYAKENGFDTLVTHHPMLFRGVKSVVPENLSGARVITAIMNGITVMSFHTRCDAADGGVNDALCLALGFEPAEKFGDADAPTLGRIANIDGITAGELAKLAKDKLGCSAVRVNGDLSKVVTRVALCGGDGKDFVYPALASECDAYITGDAGYNMAGDAAEEGLVTIEVGHFHSENPVCYSIRDAIAKTGVEVEIYSSCTYTVV